MDMLEFVKRVRIIRARFPGMSVTSWGRSVAHNAAVGGVSLSKHLDWCAVDVVWDVVPPLEELEEVCVLAGLRVIREQSHDHLEVLDVSASR